MTTNVTRQDCGDYDLMAVIAGMLAARGWFVKVEASRVNEHFGIALNPAPGWALLGTANSRPPGSDGR